ncbi:DUF131 domain-containing protein [Ferroplasma sp. Type II]|uniref:TIGR00304 family membrane protein n=1 Tax=Ferroplasma sp. Type II TaxID=261388 RepID=UPI0025BBA2DB|nr:DUF131 domain-containing protein [Ferroplasma sp. Type II]
MIVLAIEGFIEAGLFLFFPFVISSSPLAIIPFMLIFSGIILLFISFPSELNKKYDNPDEMYHEYHREYEQEDGKKESHVGGFLMIGPIPIIFGNDRRLIYISIAIAISIIAIYLVITFHLL